ncbi:MAG: FtsQ-type POTRA domain-containing protein, partial [Sphaerochaeta sp.]|nr:FtsQ-type POTRA domain-containing protein [Sphaerochaeta sp.]MDX9915975.1 FtsQ-type POTRA domain-containing protein [Sphaerochaeta sp.]
MKLKTRLLLVFLLMAALLALVWLYTSGFYTVKQVVITTEGEGEAVSCEAKALLSTLVGKPLMRLSPSKEAARLRELATVEEATVRRTLPDTIRVHLTGTESLVVVHSSDDGSFYLIKEGRLVETGQEDASSYQQRVMTIEVPSCYAHVMVRWGVDELFGQVIELTHSLGSESSLITRVKYDNNSSNSFGKMVLELSSLHAQIWVRE